MYTYHKPFFVVILLLLLSYPMTAKEPNKTNTDTYSQIEHNYLEGLKTTNIGIQKDCAFHLANMKSQKAVEPLIELMTDDFSFEPLRVVAAYALIKIGNEEGLRAVKNVAKNCNREQVRLLCEFVAGFPNEPDQFVYSGLVPLKTKAELDIEERYVEALDNSNIGIKKDAIYYLGKRHSAIAVEPLIEVLNDKFTSEFNRMLAAISLLKINNYAGVEAVTQISTTSENEQLRDFTSYLVERFR